MSGEYKNTEKLLLEQQVAALKKELSHSEAIKEVNERSLPLIQEGIDATKAGLAHHKNNIRHMVRVADVVSLDEYQKSQTHVASLSGSLESSQVDLSEAQSNLGVADRAIESCTASLAVAHQKLKQFGQLLQFKRA